MAQHVYLGPAETFNGKSVPKDGLKVTLADEVYRDLVRTGHRFTDAEMVEAEKPTPEEVNAAAESGKKK